MLIRTLLLVVFTLSTYTSNSQENIDIPNLKNASIENILDSIKSRQIQNPAIALSYIDFLENVCKNVDNQICHKDSIDSYRTDCLLKLAARYTEIDLDTTILYVEQAEKIFAETQNKDGMMECQLIRGRCHMIRGEFDQSIKIQNEYIAYFTEKNAMHKVAGAHYANTISYGKMGQLDKSIESNLLALEIFEQQKDTNNIAKCYLALGINSRNLKQYDESAKYYDKVTEIYESTNDEDGLLRVLINKANMMFSKGDTLGCIPLYVKASKIAKRINSLRGMSMALHNASNAYYQLERYDSSLYYIKEAYDLTKDRFGPRGIYMTEYKLGSIYVETGETKKGVQFLDKAFTTSEELRAFIDARDISAYLANAYAQTGNFTSAYEYQKKHVMYRDSVLDIEIANGITEMKTKYDTEKKENEITQLELEEKINSLQIAQQRTGLFGLGGALVLLSFLLWRNRKQNQKISEQNDIISEALSQKDILLKEIHHRVKNNLQVISSLLNLQSRSIDDEKAKEAIQEGRTRVHSMSLIHQSLYKDDNLTGIEMEAYLKKLCNELMSTYNLSDGNIELVTNVPDIMLDVESVVPIGLIVNELITNSLKYAFPENRSGKIVVSLEEKNGELVLTVSDNGVGFQSSNIDGTNNQTFGHKLINAFKKKLNGELTVKSKDGTQVQMKIKNYKKVA